MTFCKHQRKKPQKGLIIHANKGSQYIGVTLRSIVENNGRNLSNSRKGNSYDNAIMKSFYRTLKRELINDIRTSSTSSTGNIQVYLSHFS